MKITKTSIKGLPPAGNQRRIFWDAEDAGFGVVQHPSGAVSYLVQFRIGGRAGKQVKKKLGDFPATSPERARELARNIRSHGTIGVDIIGENRRKLAAEKAADDARVTMEVLANRFRARKMATKAAKSKAEDERRITKIVLPCFAKRDVASISTAELDALHKGMADRPYEANRLLALLSSMFSLAIVDKVRLDNPAKGISRFAETARERYLSDAEASALSVLLDELAEQHFETVSALRLLLLTGARRNEILDAKWDQFDFESMLWKRKTKTGVRTTPISTVAANVLMEIREQTKRSEGPVFSNTIDGRITALKRLWREIQSRLEFKARIQDLRHTFASVLANRQATIYEVSKLLGHKSITTSQRYSHLFPGTLRAAIEKAAR
jgi:integrase